MSYERYKYSKFKVNNMDLKELIIIISAFVLLGLIWIFDLIFNSLENAPHIIFFTFIIICFTSGLIKYTEGDGKEKKTNIIQFK